ncbi:MULTISPECIES: uracil-DNA glycosylase family protein [unclassified Mesorhizobium]|uniref:uracil-DNA glycosylase family protein n=1 Tax=unclassified Mesorhizobium TaxID=325217 RepID=UPI000FD4194F|nr:MULTISPECIES: uracil-DNA glycosylase family protein [unclassified Mesorhizobium]RUW22688.1 hypothetical protein EOA34_20645 [Mesorhizobium sp. M4B.F.Ca.ET.013.02.1.1]TGV22741.1 hypothetical protein EN786_28495 [Mesorhizobium sp. M4B.F.Ca.ET.143.01.1.1]TIT92979.1 MAG: hypothetical protein E5W55_17045 [Mesorhizobium sp.]TIU13889.1 MAG: hypothetical protein E5W44_01545 [Mesorhizobium sp.]
MIEQKILFLGLCAKKNADGGLHAPLAPTSRSGSFLASLLAELPLGEIAIARDNIIPGPVFGQNGVERNPTWAELLPWLRDHWLWRDDTLAAIVAFGAEAERAFAALAAERSSDTPVYFLHHPSYALRQPKNRRAEYARKLSQAIVATDASIAARL